MGLGGVVAEAKHNLGHVLGCLGRLEEAAVVEGEALAMFEALDKRMTAACHKYLAMILLDAGRLEDAERHARAAIAVPELAPTFRPHVHAALANVLVARHCAPRRSGRSSCWRPHVRRFARRSRRYGATARPTSSSSPS